MKISRSFEVNQPPDVVWALFQDVPALAECMPGASLTQDKGDGVYAGQVAIRLGPFTAAFEGEATHRPDPQARTGHADGKGFDRKGGSRTKLSMDYAVRESGGATEVDVDAQVQLSGPIAQFGRAGVIEETANLLIGQFVANIEKKLSSEQESHDTPDVAARSPEAAEPVPADNAVNGLALLRVIITGYFKKLFSAAR